MRFLIRAVVGFFHWLVSSFRHSAKDAPAKFEVDHLAEPPKSAQERTGERLSAGNTLGPPQLHSPASQDQVLAESAKLDSTALSQFDVEQDDILSTTQDNRLPSKTESIGALPQIGGRVEEEADEKELLAPDEQPSEKYKPRQLERNREEITQWKGDREISEKSPDEVGNASIEPSAIPASHALSDPSTVPRPPNRRRTAPQYRPPPGSAPRERSTESADQPATRTSSNSNRTNTIDIRILFVRGGTCVVSLLPKRPANFPDTVSLPHDSDTIELVALQDDWYQDLFPGDIASILLSGVALFDEKTASSWVLSGREIYVLAPRNDLRGFISSTRLVIGRGHVVLCTNLRRPEVESTLRQAGCSNWSTLDESDGIPAGWFAFRDVVPRRAIAQNPDIDILNVLRPFPDIQIEFENGIRLEHNTFIEEFPPQIRIYGEPADFGQVLIDGRAAELDDSGGYTAPSWNELGDHQVWCNSVSKTYSIVTSNAKANVWPAHTFVTPGMTRDYADVLVCGPLVYCLKPKGSDQWDNDDIVQGIVVAATNRAILGANPGDISIAPSRNEMSDDICFACAPFEAIWAIPVDPLRCKKHSHRIHLIGNSAAIASSFGALKLRPSPASVRWCRLILDASRKGLAIEPSTPEAIALWRQYKLTARRIWRGLV